MWNRLKKVDISIIVPVYNMEQYLARCVDSLLQQTKEEIEILLIDDCSTDKSWNMIQEYQMQYPETIIGIHLEKNIKQGGARNIGVKAAKGQYILFVDSDDWVEEDICCDLYAVATRTNADIIGGMYREVDEYGVCKKIGKHVLESTPNQQENDLMMLKTHHYPFGKLIKRKMILDNQLFFPEGTFFEDVVTGPLYACYAKSIQSINKVYYNYFQRSTSVMHTIDVWKTKQEIACGEQFLAECKKRKIYDRNPEIIIAKFFLSACVYPYKHMQGLERVQSEELMKKIFSVVQKEEVELTHNQYIPFLIEKNVLEYLLPKDINQNPEIIDCFTGYMSCYERIAVWGAGLKGREFIKDFEMLSKRIMYVIDKNRKLHGMHLKSGQRIVDFYEYQDKIDTIVVVNSNYTEDIKRELQERGIQKKIIDYERIIVDLIRQVEDKNRTEKLIERS